jgi:hypothetical protein
MRGCLAAAPPDDYDLDLEPYGWPGGPSARIFGWLHAKRRGPTGKLGCELSGRVGKTRGSERRSKLTAKRNARVCLALALLAVVLAVPTIAQAHRAATPAERSEMERSAVVYHENPNSDVPGTNVTVRNVKVSTAGPWALASVAVTAKATGEQAGGPEAFRKIDGRWTDVGFFNQEPASMLPKAVAKDLGVPYLPSNESGHPPSTSGNRSTSGSSGFLHGATFHVLLGIELCVSWLVGIFFMLSAWLRLPSDFKRVGRSKSTWMAVTSLGLIPFVGFIPALVYYFRVYTHLLYWDRVDRPPRPKPVRRAPSRSAGRRVPTGSRPGSHQSPPPQPREKQRCGGGCSQGKVNCTGCSGGYVSGSRTERHIACGGTGKMTCQMCGGTGYR